MFVLFAVFEKIASISEEINFIDAIICTEQNTLSSCEQQCFVYMHFTISGLCLTALSSFSPPWVFTAWGCMCQNIDSVNSRSHQTQSTMTDVAHVHNVVPLASIVSCVMIHLARYVAEGVTTPHSNL